MFAFAKKRIVLWPVTIHVPDPNGSGKTTNVDVKVKYILLSRSEMSAMLRDAKKLTDDAKNNVDIEQYADKMDRTLLERIVGWEGINDAATNEPLPFSVENLEALLDIPYVRTQFDNGLWESSHGAPAKNSLPGSDGSQAPTESVQATASSVH